MSPTQQFNIGDRVEWLGFVKANTGETVRPVGTLGTITPLGAAWRGRVDVVYVQWDGTFRSESTWVENVRVIAADEPAEIDPELRERMLAEAIRASDFSATPDEIVVAALAFEAYVTGATK